MPALLTTVLEALPYLLEGCATTIGIVAASMVLGLLLGVPLSVGQVYGPGPVRLLVRLYVWFFRGTPILVLLFLFYYGLPELLGFDVSAFAASCLVLGFASAAYQSQIFRGAIISLPAGQLKAARALGMQDGTAIRQIILPQALRLSIPGWTNEYSILLKDSAVAFILGTQEIMARTHFVATRTYEHLVFYSLAGLLYFLITLAGIQALRRLEKKVHIPGYAIG